MSRTRFFELRSPLASLFAAIFTLASSTSEFVWAQNTPTPARVRVERADQLPRHLYPIETTAMALFQDDAQFAALAKRLCAQIS